MFREEMQVLGLPGAEDVTDGSVDYYDMDWENVENGVTEEQMAKCIAKECACTPHCKCSGKARGAGASLSVQQPVGRHSAECI